MTDRPIIFSAPMVRALLEGRKTQTRRIVRVPKWASTNPDDIEADDVGGANVICTNTGCFSELPLPYAPGDRLWVREAWKAHSTFEDRAPALIPRSTIFYEADRGYSPSGSRIRASIHLPRWASRITLLVSTVHVERVQDINLNDVCAEGCEVRQFWLFGADAKERQRIGANVYRTLWTDLHGSDSWSANPWVVALSFRAIAANIDSVEAS